MKKLVLIGSALMLAAALGAAELAGAITVKISPVRKNPAEIKPMSGPGLTELVASNSNPGSYFVTFSVNAGEECRPAVEFKAESDGQVGIMFFVQSPRERNSVAVSQLTVNGKAVANPDFSKRSLNGNPKGFWMSTNPDSRPEIIPAQDGNPAAIRVAHGRSFTMPLTVRTGETYRIGFRLTPMAAYPAAGKL